MRKPSRLLLHKVYDTVATVLWAIVAVGAVLGAEALIQAPERRAAAQQMLAEEIAREDRSVCGRLGIHPGAASFEACVSELTKIRHNEMLRQSQFNLGPL